MQAQRKTAGTTQGYWQNFMSFFFFFFLSIYAFISHILNILLHHNWKPITVNAVEDSAFDAVISSYHCGFTYHSDSDLYQENKSIGLMH